MEDTPTPFAELDNGPSKFEIFLEKNQKALMAGSIAIFLGVLGYVGYTSFGELKAAEAGSALSSATENTDIQSVISTYANTATAGSATLLLAENQANESTETSIATLRSFVDTYTSHPALPSAATKLGLALLNEGKLTEAEAHLNTVLDMENADFVIPAAQLGLGDIAKANNDKAKAKQLYTEVANLTNNGPAAISKYSLYSSMAKTRLRFLEATAPSEVEKKAAPIAVPQPQISTTVESDDKNAPAAE